METEISPDLASVMLHYQIVLDARGTPAGQSLRFYGGSAKEINSAIGGLGLGEALAKENPIILADAATLADEAIFQLPKNCIIEPSADTAGEPILAARCRALHDAGFRLALRGGGWQEEILPLASIVVIDSASDDATISAQIAAATGSERQLLADGLLTHRRMEECRTLGCTLLRGIYFARPRPESEQRPMNASQLGIIRLLNLVAREAGQNELEESFKREPGLTVNLLRLVNSVGIGAAKRVDSLRHAIAILGRKQLMRWLQLLLMAAPGGGSTPRQDPLLQMAALRGNLLERLTAICAPSERAIREEAFLVGVMSLMPVALGQPISAILAQIPVAESVERALVAHEGTLGRLLQLIETLEDGDPAASDALLTGLAPLDRASVSSALCAVIVWLHGEEAD